VGKFLSIALVLVEKAMVQDSLKNLFRLREEVQMAVKVLIRRKMNQENEQELSVLLRELRTLTTNRKGYISGESFNRLDKPGESLVISTWQSADDWREWVLSPERQTLQSKIDTLIGVETDYEIYEYA
jgi:heme-degrading monooxygenase HmoA